MNRKTLSYALIIALTGSMALVGCKKKEEPVVTPPAATEPAPAPMASEPAPAPATSVTTVTVGNTAAADKSVAAVATFAPTDKIIVSVKTDGTAANQEIGAKLTFQDGQVAGDQKATINATDAGTTNIEFANANKWPVGKYTIDTTLNGAPVGMQQSIEVK